MPRAAKEHEIDGKKVILYVENQVNKVNNCALISVTPWRRKYIYSQ